VSLLPSTTEILFAVGAGDDVVGVTFECDYPPAARSRQIVSTSTLPEGLSPAEIDAVVRERLAAGEDLYRLHEGSLRGLDPQLVITQDLCAVCAVDVSNVNAALDHLGCRAAVLTIDPGKLDEVLESIAMIGKATDRVRDADALVGSLRSRLDRVASAVGQRRQPRVLVLEWTDPPFTAGHWVPDMVSAAGAVPLLGVSGERSTQSSWEAIGNCGAELVIVAPCGFDLNGARELAAGLIADGLLPPGLPVWAVDADAAFVRPGPRLVDGVEALAAICHPEVFAPRPDVAYLAGVTFRG
jgi:iron complex transport system substrate-binding protein